MYESIETAALLPNCINLPGYEKPLLGVFIAVGGHNGKQPNNRKIMFNNVNSFYISINRQYARIRRHERKRIICPRRPLRRTEISYTSSILRPMSTISVRSGF